MRVIISDLHYAVRNLGRYPAFVLAAVLSLAFGFGLNALLLSGAGRILTAPLPFAAADRLVTVWESNLRQGLPEVTLSRGNFLDVRGSAKSFEMLTSYVIFRPVLRQEDVPEEIAAVLVTPNWLEMTGVHPLLGRGFTEEEYLPAAHPVVIISHRCWRTRFGGDKGIIGKSVELDRVLYQVVGVLPPGFDFPRPLIPELIDAWVPSRISPAEATRKFHGLYTVGRLRPGVTIEQANAELSDIGLRLRQMYPATNSGWTLFGVRLRDQVTRDSRRLLVLLGSVSILILLIATANVSIMWFARAIARRRDVSLRLALGASGWSAIRPLLIETVLLASAGALTGLLVVSTSTELIGTFAATNRLIYDPNLFRTTAATTSAIAFLALLTGLAAGAGPALYIVRRAATDPAGQMQRTQIADGWFGAHSALAMLQIALSVTVLTGSGLLGINYWLLVHSDFGRRSSNVVVARIRPPIRAYADPSDRRRLYSSLVEGVRSLPGVYAAGLASALSLPEGGELHIHTEGVGAGAQKPQLADVYIVSPGFFPALGAVIDQGRDFGDADTEDRPPVIIVNSSLARRYWPGENPIGKRVVIENMGKAPHTIVGVVQDIEHFNLTRTHQPEIYAPFLQRPYVQMWAIAATSTDPAALFNAVQHLTWAIDRDVYVTNFGTFEELHASTISKPRLQTFAISAMGGIALLLTVLGVYAVVAYQSAQRLREFAIRTAMGASPLKLFACIMNKVGVLVTVGAFIGLVGALAASRLVRWFLFGASALTPLAMIGSVALVSLAIACGASVPAFKATRVPPMEVLKEQ